MPKFYTLKLENTLEGIKKYLITKTKGQKKLTIKKIVWIDIMITFELLFGFVLQCFGLLLKLDILLTGLKK